jgi:hypothetical protein
MNLPVHSQLENTLENNSTPTTKELITQPIPPPSYPKQYRAIGLIRGKYQPTEEKLSKGSLIIDKDRLIDAVLLGRIISLVKNHVDLEREHLWVVYPRTKQDTDDFQAQILGLWEPETLKKNLVGEKASAQAGKLQNGYFSIRGEVIFSSSEEGKVIVKIVQAPRKQSETAKFFKLKLKGKIPDQPIGHFFNFEAALEENILVIKEANDLGLLPGRGQLLRPRQNTKPKTKT